MLSVTEHRHRSIPEVWVTEAVLPCPRLPPAFEGVRILHFSDLHFRRRSARRHERWGAALQDLKADLAVFTGDTVDRPPVWPAASEWARRWTPQTDWRFAVAGNWDYHRDSRWPDFASCWQAAGYAPLRNESRICERGPDRIVVAGLDDIRRGAPDPAAALRGAGTDDFVLLLCHNPDVLLEYEGQLSYDVMVSGHTHGGQVRIPGYGALLTSTRLGKRLEAGLCEWEPGRWVYVNRGLGAGRYTFRLFCPPEITVLTLRRAPATGRPSRSR